MKKRIISFVLASVMAAAVAVPAFADDVDFTPSATYGWDMPVHYTWIVDKDGNPILAEDGSEQEVQVYHKKSLYLKVTPVVETIDAVNTIDEDHDKLEYKDKMDIYSSIRDLTYQDSYELTFLYDLLDRAQDNETFLTALAPEEEVLTSFTAAAEKIIAEVDPEDEKGYTIEDFKATAMYKMTPSEELYDILQENGGAVVSVPIDDVDGIEVGDKLIIVDVKGYNKLANVTDEYTEQNFEDLEATLAEGIDKLDLDCDVIVIEDYTISEKEVDGEKINTLEFNAGEYGHFGQVAIFKLVEE